MRRTGAEVFCLLLLLIQVYSGSLQDVETRVSGNAACDQQVQQIECFYDPQETAIIGLQYTLRISRARRSVCRTHGRAGTTITVRGRSGISQIAVTTVDSKIKALEFRFNTGRRAACRASGSPTNLNSTASGTATISSFSIAAASPAGDPAVVSRPPTGTSLLAAGILAPTEAVTRNTPVNVSSDCTAFECTGDGCLPPCIKPPTGRIKVYFSPNSSLVLGGLSGQCLRSSSYNLAPLGSLRYLSSPCWVALDLSPSPSPSPKPPSPSPRPQSPSPSPSPAPGPNPAIGQDGVLAVTLFSRGQTDCGVFDARSRLQQYLDSTLVLLGVGGFAIKQIGSVCPCSVSQNVPMYTCKYTVQGPQANNSMTWDGAAAASYLAASITAAGQQICSAGAAEASPDFCSSSTKLTGLCAAAIPINGTTNSSGNIVSNFTASCNMLKVPAAWQISVSLGQPAAGCIKALNLTDSVRNSLVQYLSGFLPGYSTTVPGWATKALKCIRGQGNGYYQIPAVSINPGSQIDLRGAAEYLAATINRQQQSPCSSSSSPEFCSIITPPSDPTTLCVTTSYRPTDPVYECANTGASFSLAFAVPDDTCSRGNPPPVELAQSLDRWWAVQLSLLRNGTLYSARTVTPGTAKAGTSKAGGSYCTYSYRIAVTGAPFLTAFDVGDKALELMSNAVAYRPKPCTQWSTMDMCKYFGTATLCAANPYLPEYPLMCVPDTSPDGLSKP